MTEEIKDFRFRDNTRAPFETEVRLRFDRFGGTISAFSADISMEGMFVKTEEPKPIGTLVQFEFSLHEGELIQGLGDVVWVRAEQTAAGKPKGMGIQFRYVDPQSRDLIYHIVSQYLEDRKTGPGEPGEELSSEVGSGDPFGLTPAPAATPGATEEALTPIDELVLGGLPASSPQERTEAIPMPPVTQDVAPTAAGPENATVELSSLVASELEDTQQSPVVSDAAARPALSAATPPVQPAATPPVQPVARISPPPPAAPAAPPPAPGRAPGGGEVKPAMEPAAPPKSPPEPMFDFQPQVELPDAVSAQPNPESGAGVMPPRISSPPVSPSASAFDAVFGSSSEVAEAAPPSGGGASPFKQPPGSTVRARPQGRSRLGLWMGLLLVIALAAAGWTFRDSILGLLNRGGESPEAATQPPGQLPGEATQTGAGRSPPGGDDPGAEAGSAAAAAAGPGSADAAQDAAVLDAGAGSEPDAAPLTTVPPDTLPPDTPASDATVSGASATPPTSDAETAGVAVRPPATVTPPTRLTSFVAQDGAQSTSIVLAGDRPFAADGYSALSLSSPARFVLKLDGIGEVPSRPAVSRRLQGVRSAIHGDAQSPELHLVFDLAAENIRASARLREDGTIEVRLRDG